METPDVAAGNQTARRKRIGRDSALATTGILAAGVEAIRRRVGCGELRNDKKKCRRKQ